MTSYNLFLTRYISMRNISNISNGSTKRANFGRIISYLKDDGIPNLLNKNPLLNYLDENIKLRLFPLSISLIPTLQGISQYNTSLNILRLFCTNFILKNSHSHPKHLHIISIEPIEKIKDSKLFITENDKLLVKWQSCPYRKNNEMDENLDNSQYKLNIIDYLKDPENELNQKLNDKMLRGHFIFELNDDNSKILVHTIENIELFNLKKKQRTANSAFVC